MERLKELRSAAELNQRQTSLLIGVSERQYSRWETGKQSPSLKKLIRIAQLYNISFDSLINSSNTDNNTTEQD